MGVTLIYDEAKHCKRIAKDSRIHMPFPHYTIFRTLVQHGCDIRNLLANRWPNGDPRWSQLLGRRGRVLDTVYKNLLIGLILSINCVVNNEWWSFVSLSHPKCSSLVAYRLSVREKGRRINHGSLKTKLKTYRKMN